MAEHPTPKLIVILHADVVGSTKLVHQNETLAHARIQDAFQRLSSTIEAYNGVTQEIRGDALLAEFMRARDAVVAALAFQVENAESNARLEDDLRPQLRVGISLGEVVIADGTVTGAGVVLAQRVEQLAEPGGVCITGAVHEAVPQHLPFDYSDLGKREAKGFDDPVQVYSVGAKVGKPVPSPEPAVRAQARKPKLRRTAAVAALLILIGGALMWWQPWKHESEPAPMEGIAAPQPEQPSIAVLPFTNMSDDPQQEYFSDGLTEDLITDISRISGLRVIARHSSFAYKGEGGDIQKIARELGARYVLEGSVRRSGDRLRINAQLIDAADGAHMWAERFDRKLIDVFELQDELTQTIVSALAVNLTLEEEQFLNRVKTGNPDAYDALLRGLESLHRFTGEDSALAREYFNQAIALDPDYARAHANLSLTHSQDVSFGWSDDPQESNRLALESVERAEALDDTITQTHFARSNLYAVQQQYEDAEISIRRAIELEPNYADGYGELAFVLTHAGEQQDALTAIQKAKRLNPRYPFVYLWLEGHIYFLMGQYEKAIPVLQEALNRNPAFATARLVLIATYGQLGREEDAAWELDELLTIRPDYSLSTARNDTLYKRSEDLERFIEGLHKAGIPD